MTTCPIIIFLEFYYEEKFHKIEGFTLNIWKQHAKPPVENTCVVGLLTQNLKNEIGKSAMNIAFTCLVKLICHMATQTRCQVITAWGGMENYWLETPAPLCIFLWWVKREKVLFFLLCGRSVNPDAERSCETNRVLRHVSLPTWSIKGTQAKVKWREETEMWKPWRESLQNYQPNHTTE